MPLTEKAMIANLKKELDRAFMIDEKKLSDMIKDTGFQCKNCAGCCMNEFGDNTVIVYPSQIKKICDKYGFKRENFVIPTPSDDRDKEGNIHTFEWILKKNGDCIFLKEKLCEIYECRPFICKTYPFYLIDGELKVCECMGIGENISDKDSIELAVLLKERYILDIKESIAVLEKFNGFNTGGSGIICVHDSEGEHWIK